MYGMYSISDFGAVGDGMTLCTHAVQEAIDACANSGGEVVVPPGSYVIGTIRMRSNVILRLMFRRTTTAAVSGSRADHGQHRIETTESTGITED